MLTARRSANSAAYPVLSVAQNKSLESSTSLPFTSCVQSLGKSCCPRLENMENPATSHCHLLPRLLQYLTGLAVSTHEPLQFILSLAASVILLKCKPIRLLLLKTMHRLPISFRKSQSPYKVGLCHLSSDLLSDCSPPLLLQLFQPSCCSLNLFLSSPSAEDTTQLSPRVSSR